MSFPHGTVLRSPIDRFADKIALTEAGCIEWIAGTQGEGYGQFFGGRRVIGEHGKIAAHRWSYEYHVGPIPAGMEVDHLCRNRLCVNPARGCHAAGKHQSLSRQRSQDPLPGQSPICRAESLRLSEGLALLPRVQEPSIQATPSTKGKLVDLTQSIEPRSDQINSDDLITGPITYTIREVITGKAESPFDFLLVETDRAYRPSKTMRRVIVNAWGAEASNYAGRRLTLYREPSIMFGGQKVGGIRIRAMSHIDGPLEVMAQVTRGKREKFTVTPLADLTPADKLRAEWKSATPERRTEIEAEVKALTNGGS